MLTAGAFASCNTGFGGDGKLVSPDFFSTFAALSCFCEPAWRSFRSAIHAGSDADDLVSQVVSDDDPFAGVVEESSSFAEVLVDAMRSGDEVPDGELRAWSSVLARSIALSLPVAHLTSPDATLCDCAGFSLTLASTSSAQFPPLASSVNGPVAGVAAPDVALLVGVWAVVVAGDRPFAA